MFCVRCGSKHRENANFCMKCGLSVMQNESYYADNVFIIPKKENAKVSKAVLATFYSVLALSVILMIIGFTLKVSERKIKINLENINYTAQYSNIDSSICF